MTVVLVEPYRATRIAEVGNDLKAMQQAVGGYIEAIYPYEDSVAIICNEEGKLQGLPLNRALKTPDGEMYDVIAGTFIVCGLGEDNFESLSPELQNKYLREFEHPQEFFMDANTREITVVNVPERKPKQQVELER